MDDDEYVNGPPFRRNNTIIVNYNGDGNINRRRPMDPRLGFIFADDNNDRLRLNPRGNPLQYQIQI